jgi:hypothetical protein
MVVKFGLYPNDPGADRKLSEHLHIQEIPNTRAVTIQFDYPDQRIVQRVTQNVVSLFVKQSWNFEVIDAPNFPQNPYSPNRALIAGGGLFLGFLAAVALRVTGRSGYLVAAGV